jgi:aspartate racemase
LSTRGGTRSRDLPPEILDGLRTLGRQEGATLFMTALAAFQTLLHRYSAQEDISVGTPIAGRTHAELENLIGLFVNTLVLRVDLSGDPTFRELLQRVKPIALEAYVHQDLPFDQVATALGWGRDRSRAPLFQVMFVLQDAAAWALETTELKMVPLDAETGTAKFDLTLFLIERETGLRASLEYSSDLFDAGTIDRMLGHFEVLLSGIIRDPDQPIANLPMLTDAEQRELLNQWNDAEADELDLTDEELADLEAEPDGPRPFDPQPVDPVPHLSSEEQAVDE